jgi:hypothetical protein
MKEILMTFLLAAIAFVGAPYPHPSSPSIARHKQNPTLPEQDRVRLSEAFRLGDEVRRPSQCSW